MFESFPKWNHFDSAALPELAGKSFCCLLGAAIGSSPTFFYFGLKFAPDLIHRVMQ
jgi:hypothetical protein